MQFISYFHKVVSQWMIRTVFYFDSLCFNKNEKTKTYVILWSTVASFEFLSYLNQAQSSLISFFYVVFILLFCNCFADFCCSYPGIILLWQLILNIKYTRKVNSIYRNTQTTSIPVTNLNKFPLLNIFS